MSTRQKFDLKRPDARKISDEIVHGAFTTEGTMAAFPTCFPAVTVPIPADESRIRALDVAHNIVYAGTSGRASHLLVGMFHGVTGMVFDMGTIRGATDCAAIVCGETRFVAAANSAERGYLVTRELQPLPFDLIQEWHVSRKPLTEIGQELNGEKIVHLIGNGSDLAIGITPTRLFQIDITSGKTKIVASLSGRSRLARGSKGVIYGIDEASSLWRYDPVGAKLERRAVPLPAGDWAGSQYWARDMVTEALYTADADGRLFSLDGNSRFSGPLAALPVRPGGPMAVTLDGRLYGTFGEGMSMLFCYNPDTQELKTLGVAVSVLERRRYGYSFGAAAVGRDGQIFFGEDDNLGHLWIYFPSIQRRAKP